MCKWIEGQLLCSLLKVINTVPIAVVTTESFFEVLPPIIINLYID